MIKYNKIITNLAGVVALVSCLEAGDCAPPVSSPGILMKDYMSIFVG